MTNILKKLKSQIIRKRNPLIDKLIRDGLTYMWPSDLIEMESSISRIQKGKIKGVFLEAGVALGGSAIFLCAKKATSTPLFLYDVFDMIPEPSDEDEKDVHVRYQKIISGQSKGINGNTYYGYQDDLLSIVKKNFVKYDLDTKSNNVSFYKGKFQEVMSLNQEVALAHLDCDWYESVKYCLDQIHPNLAIGGEFIIDDYFHYSGCRKAVDEFLEKHNDVYTTFEKAKFHLVKTQ